MMRIIEFVWELSHRNKMLKESEGYAGVLPNLRWIFCGGWSINFKCPGDKSFGNAFPASRTRLLYMDFWHQIFGLGESRDY